MAHDHTFVSHHLIRSLSIDWKRGFLTCSKFFFVRLYRRRSPAARKHPRQGSARTASHRLPFVYFQLRSARHLDASRPREGAEPAHPLGTLPRLGSSPQAPTSGLTPPGAHRATRAPPPPHPGRPYSSPGCPRRRARSRLPAAPAEIKSPSPLPLALIRRALPPTRWRRRFTPLRSAASRPALQRGRPRSRHVPSQPPSHALLGPPTPRLLQPAAEDARAPRGEARDGGCGGEHGMGGLAGSGGA